jgi:hypothetical protein
MNTDYKKNNFLYLYIIIFTLISLNSSNNKKGIIVSNTTTTEINKPSPWKIKHSCQEKSILFSLHSKKPIQNHIPIIQKEIIIPYRLPLSRRELSKIFTGYKFQNIIYFLSIYQNTQKLPKNNSIKKIPLVTKYNLPFNTNRLLAIEKLKYLKSLEIEEQLKSLTIEEKKVSNLELRIEELQTKLELLKGEVTNLEYQEEEKKQEQNEIMKIEGKKITELEEKEKKADEENNIENVISIIKNKQEILKEYREGLLEERVRIIKDTLEKKKEENNLLKEQIILTKNLMYIIIAILEKLTSNPTYKEEIIKKIIDFEEKK